MTGPSFTGWSGFYSAALRSLRWVMGNPGATSIGLFATGAVTMEAVLVHEIAPPHPQCKNFYEMVAETRMICKKEE